MPEAFIVKKTEDAVSLEFGGLFEGIHMDGRMDVHKDETFHNWTFEELQETTLDRIDYIIIEDDDDG
jgi:hypothetical protein